MSHRAVSVAMACFTALACGADRESQPHAAAATDPPARIVSLSPAITELVFALGAGDRLVGRTRWGQDPAAALDVPSVGDGLAPNIEAIVARRPDLVLFYASPSNDAAIARLATLGIATMSVPLDGLDDLEAAARTIGERLGHGSTADSLVADLHRRLADDAHQLPTQPSVLVLAWDNPPIVIGASSFLNDIVARAGGHNVFDDQPQPSASVSIETIASRNPDVVLVTGFESPSFAEKSEWQTVPAIRERRFVMVEGTEFAHPSFRAPDAVRQLRQALQHVIR